MFLVEFNGPFRAVSNYVGVIFAEFERNHVWLPCRHHRTGPRGIAELRLDPFSLAVDRFIPVATDEADGQLVDTSC